MLDRNIRGIDIALCLLTLLLSLSGCGSLKDDSLLIANAVITKVDAAKQTITVKDDVDESTLGEGCLLDCSSVPIQKMHDFDWEVFKQERIYRLHTQDLGIGIFDEPSAEQEDKSALMKKFLESVSHWDDYTTASRYGWIEGIGDQRLVRVLKRLSISEKELLTKYCIEDKTQQEIAAEMGLSQRAVGKQLQQLKKFFKKF